MTVEQSKTDKRTEGCYIAYNDDWSGMAVFSSEVQALRYAVERSMKVARVPFGVDLREAVTPAAPAVKQTPTSTTTGASV